MAPEMNERTTKQETLKLHGTVTTGVREAGRITELPWIKQQFIEKLGINPYPGTFNITLPAADRNQLSRIRQAKSVTIISRDDEHCSGISLHVLVGGKIKGAIVIPLIPDYPPDQLEIIAAENIRHALNVKDGDTVEVTVYL